MANDPIRLRIQKALSACLEEITPANGYNYDLTGAVFRGRSQFGVGDPLPMLSILETPIPIENLPPPVTSVVDKMTWELVIQGFVDDDKRHPTDPAQILMADVKRRLIIEKKKNGRTGGYSALGMGGLITDIRLGPGVVRPPDQEVSSKAYFWMNLTINFVEDMENPY